MLTKLRSFRNQKGISLLEVMLSLAIIAIILVMATRYFGIASSSSKVNQALSEMKEVQGGISKYLNINGNMPPDLATLAKLNYITQTTATGINPWNGKITMSGTGEVTMDGLPTPECNSLADMLDVACEGGSTIHLPLNQN